MTTYHRFRYLNTNPYNIDDRDCTIRAISLFLNKEWDEVYWGICRVGFDLKRMPSTNITWKQYLKEQGYEPIRIPHYCPDCYTVNEFTEQHKQGAYLLKVDEHVVTVIDGYYYDTWDSGDEVVLYYYERRDY